MHIINRAATLMMPMTHGNGEDAHALSRLFSDRIPAMHIINRAATFTMLMSHGNGGDLFQNAEVLHNLSNQLGVSVLMYEYCGAR